MKVLNERNAKIGERIALQRNLNKVSQKDLAKFLHVNRLYLTRLENGGTKNDIDEKILIKIANYLKCTSDYLTLKSDFPEEAEDGKEMCISFNFFNQIIEKLNNYTEINDLSALPILRGIGDIVSQHGKSRLQIIGYIVEVFSKKNIEDEEELIIIAERVLLNYREELLIRKR